MRLVTSDGEAVTVVGTIPCAAPGEDLVVTGRWVSHPVHGEQVEARQVERHMPTTENEILCYLASGIIKGVGPATADRMVQRFGESTLRVLEEEPELLTKIKGITPRRAKEIGESYRYQTGMRRLLEFLSLNDLPLSLALRLYRRYGGEALEAVRENPYLLVDELYGVAVGAGMNNIEVKGADGTLETNYEGKAEAAVKAVTEDGNDFVYIHVEAPDEMGHQGSVEKKIKAIEYLDKRIIGPVYNRMKELGEDFRMLIMPDHPTPICTRTHSSDPVPYLLYDSTSEEEHTWNYNEKEAEKSGNYQENGYQLMKELLGSVSK